MTEAVLSRTLHRTTLLAPALTLAAWCAADLWAADGKGGELGVLGGLVAPDEALAFESSPSPELFLGLRGGSVFARRWTWYIDGLYTSIGTAGSLGDARTTVGRTGLDFSINPDGKRPWYLTLGGGWMSVDFEDASFADFHRPLVSMGLGQNIRLPRGSRVRWELRGDLTVDDARLGGEDVLLGYLVGGWIWGPSSRIAARGLDDADRDGVRDRRDACPNTPAGATVDAMGCPRDSDRDGVLDGLDRCPGTDSNALTDADGCTRDSDGDGVHDGSDACVDTPPGATVDEWGCPSDGDGDGVPNGIDRCDFTPEGARVDEAGCPTDSDGDGVYDGIDECSGTPPGTAVDPRGCAD